MEIDRRQFIGVSMLPGWLTPMPSQAQGDAPRILFQGDVVRVEAARYSFVWSQKDDRFRIMDSKGRIMVSGTGEPAIVRLIAGAKASASSPGRVSSKSVNGNRLVVTYEGVNQAARVTVTWRFDDENLWFEPVTYETSSAEDIVALHYFSKATGSDPEPSLEHTYLIHPALSESSSFESRAPDFEWADAHFLARTREWRPVGQPSAVGSAFTLFLRYDQPGWARS